MQFSAVKYSRCCAARFLVSFSGKTETVPIKQQLPSPRPQPLVTTILLSDSVHLTTRRTSCTWNHMVFVFLWHSNECTWYSTFLKGKKSRFEIFFLWLAYKYKYCQLVSFGLKMQSFIAFSTPVVLKSMWESEITWVFVKMRSLLGCSPNLLNQNLLRPWGSEF